VSTGITGDVMTPRLTTALVYNLVKLLIGIFLWQRVVLSLHIVCIDVAWYRL